MFSEAAKPHRNGIWSSGGSWSKGRRRLSRDHRAALNNRRLNSEYHNSSHVKPSLILLFMYKPIIVTEKKKHVTLILWIVVEQQKVFWCHFYAFCLGSDGQSRNFRSLAGLLNTRTFSRYLSQEVTMIYWTIYSSFSALWNKTQFSKQRANKVPNSVVNIKYTVTAILN